MKSNPNSTQQQTSNTHDYAYGNREYNRPKRPTAIMVEKAKFVDRTYVWNGRK